MQNYNDRYFTYTAGVIMRGSARVNRRILGGGTNSSLSESFILTRSKSGPKVYDRVLSMPSILGHWLVGTMVDFTFPLVGGVMLVPSNSTKKN